MTACHAKIVENVQAKQSSLTNFHDPKKNYIKEVKRSTLRSKVIKKF